MPSDFTPETEYHPPGETPVPPVGLRTLGFGAPLRWLALGWRDFLRAPGIGSFYGACFVAMGWALMAVFESSFEVLR